MRAVEEVHYLKFENLEKFTLFGTFVFDELIILILFQRRIHDIFGNFGDV